MKRRVEIDVRSRGLHLDAGVNEAPLARLRGAQHSSQRLPVDWWLLPEGNRLTVTLSPLDAGNDGEEAPPPRCEVALRDAEERHAPYATFGWSLPEAAEFEPFQVVIPFLPPVVPAVRLWDQAEVVAHLEDGDVGAIRHLAAGLLEAVAARRIDEVVERLADRIAELAIAVERPTDWMREATREDLERILLATDFVLRPIDLDGLRFRPCADGRVFHLETDEGLELVSAVTDEPTATPPGMQVFVARCAGRWQIVR